MIPHSGAVDCPPIPEIAPLPHDRGADSTSLSLSIVEGPTVILWSAATTTAGKTQQELKLQLQPDQSVVIGRQEGGEIKYLDPRYQPTTMLPNCSRPVVNSFRHGIDRTVSRGHFMLKGYLHVILLLNGVPRRGGGIRPPLNGTVMLEPLHRSMDEGEEHRIERGASAKIRLPNGTVILLCAE
jgi:hypothetical protein